MVYYFMPQVSYSKRYKKCFCNRSLDKIFDCLSFWVYLCKQTGNLHCCTDIYTSIRSYPPSSFIYPIHDISSTIKTPRIWGLKKHNIYFTFDRRIQVIDIGYAMRLNYQIPHELFKLVCSSIYTNPSSAAKAVIHEHLF